MAKVAIIEAKPSRNNYSNLFPGLAYEQFSLASDATLKKVLKKDVDIDINIDDYDWVVLVGSEPLKYYTSVSSITEYSGKMVDKKFLPVINPAMLKFKPEVKKLWEESRDNILGYISGKLKKAEVDDANFIGIEGKEAAIAYIRAAIADPNYYIGLDTETTGLYPRNGYILGISLSYKPDAGAYISTDCIDEEVEELLQQLFNKKVVVFHNAKFDLAMLEYHFNFKFPKFEDTMMMHYTLDETPGTHGLKQLALKYTKYGDYEQPLYAWMEAYRKEHGILKDDFKWEWIPFDVMYPYAAKDAAVTFLLFGFFLKFLEKNSRLMSVYRDILIRGTRFLTNIQDNGVPFCAKTLQTVQDRLTREIQEAVDKLYSYDEVKNFEAYQGKEFNPNSVLQLRKLLFDFLGLPATGIKTGTGEDSTNAEVLEILAGLHPVPSLILDIRKKSKIKNTYIDKILPQLDKDGKLRTNFNLAFTTSGRLSSSGKMNMQQIPRDDPSVKGCIRARPGYKIVSMDLQTAEMYIAAVLAKDTALQAIFTSGGDFHSSIAKKVFDLPCKVEEVKELYKAERQAAKAVSFGILYGAGPSKISSQVNKDGGSLSVSEAQAVISDYFKSFPRLKEWITYNNNFIKTNGYVYSAFGRKRRLPNVTSDNDGIVGHEIRSGLNFLVQSVASDVNLLGAIDAEEEIRVEKLDANIFALVHDSILAEVHESCLELYKHIIIKNVQRDRGVSIPGFPIPCDIEVGDDYSMGKYEEKYGTVNNVSSAA
jgi:DNA polymerase I-like protein with 3'-5' exonuclease and polymerase domains